MDRAIEPQEIQSRKRRRGALVVGVVVAAVIVVLGLRSVLRPGVDGARIRMAEVERGGVEATILTSGTVLPAMEQVIPSPFEARVQRVLEHPGKELDPGQAVLELDDSEVRLMVEQLRDEIALLANRRREKAEDLQSRLTELAGEQEIKWERLAFLEAKTEQQEALDELGLTTIYEMRKARLEEKVARIELRQLEERSQRERQATRTRIEGLEIELTQLRRDLAEKESRLEQATVRADRPGVLTWIAEEEGASVVKGEILARIADLSRFRIEASVSDVHANRISVGMKVRLVVGREMLAGHVSNIPPAIDKGVMTVNIELEKPDSPLLHLKQRVDVHIVTENRPDVLRIKKGPFVNGSGAQEVFVVDGDFADRCRVQIGVAGIDFYEVISGLGEGDTVIISNMDDYKHTERIRVR